MRLALLVLASCVGPLPGGRPGGGPDGGGGEPFETTRYSTDTRPNGKFTVDVEVDADTTAFQITGASDQWVGLEELYDPDGNRVLFWEDWWSSPTSLTDAFYGYTKTTAFDWPIREQDGPLAPGTWSAVWSIVDNRGYYLGNYPVDVGVALKRDPAFADGTVSVQIAWADGVDQDPAVVDAVGTAVERWREVWAAYGIALEEHYVTTDIDPSLPFAWGAAGDAAVEDAAASKGEDEVQVVIGERVGNDNWTYGVSAGIPGTIEASPSTFVVISWLVHAGADATFSRDETRLMGETMAHEVGHYAGLYHPVESTYDYWDALDDTPQCTRAGDCEDALGTNVMFPYSICGPMACVVTDQLTDDQVGVLQRYIATL